MSDVLERLQGYNPPDRTVDVDRQIAQDIADAASEITTLRARVAEWEEKARNWMASPEAAARLDGYRELALRAEAAERRVAELEAKKAKREDAGTTYWEAWSRVLKALDAADPEWNRGGIPILNVEDWIRSHAAPPARPTPTRPATCGECRYYSERDIECGIEPRQQPRAAYTPACRHGEGKP